MNVLLVNTYGLGGAAMACIRLHKALLEQGISSTLLMQYPGPAADVPGNVRFPHPPKRQPKGKVRSRKFPFLIDRNDAWEDIKKRIPDQIEFFSASETGYDFTEHPAYKACDVINLHWVSNFLDYSFFEKNTKPVIWTMHDMNPYTGGCHYSGDCTEFMRTCARCPQLEETLTPWISSQILEYKRRYIGAKNNLTLVGISEWMARSSKASSVFGELPHMVIPNGLDSEIFHPYDREKARQELGLPQDKKIILFVAYGTLHNKRKGFSLLLDAFSQMALLGVMLCSVGGKEKTMLEGTEVRDFGFVSDEREMAKLYSAADVFIIPSLQDNLPNTVVEALLCGTPVIGFDAGGIPDMIKDGVNGLLTSEKSSEALSASIMNFLEGKVKFDRQLIREDAVKRFDQHVQAGRYMELYRSVLNPA